MEVEPRPIGRTRRASITSAGEAFRVFFASHRVNYGPGLEYIPDLNRFMDSFIQITKSETKFKGLYTTDRDDRTPMKIKVSDGYTYHNVGIIGIYTNPHNTSNVHAVPYVKMNDKWYVGDDEKGMLVLRTNGPPTWGTKYSNREWKMTGMYYFYINQILPVFPIPELNRHGFHGKIAFKQQGSSCWGDSIQTVIMNANGFREQFIHLYNLVKSTPGIISDSLPHTLQNCMMRLSSILNIVQAIHYDPANHIHKTLLVLSLSFIRMMSWEPPFGDAEYVNHILGTTGLHLLQMNNTEGVDPGVNIRITEPFGGKRSKRSKRKTRKRKN